MSFTKNHTDQRAIFNTIADPSLLDASDFVRAKEVRQRTIAWNQMQQMSMP